MWTALLTLAAASCADEQDGVCLLSLRGVPSRTLQESPFRSRTQALLAWKTEHQQLRHAVSQSASSVSLDMDAFIAAQQGSTDFCHAKMLEAKRTLDGLHAKVLALSGEIEAHDAIILAQTGIIDESTQKKQEAADELTADMQKCQDAYDNEMKEVFGYDKELIELRQIADPSVRSAIQHDTNYHDEWHETAQKETVAQTAAAETEIATAADAWRKVAEWNITKGPSLLAKEWTTSQCEAAKGVLRRLRPLALVDTAATPGVNVTYIELDCNGTRKELQDEFTTAYEEIAKLRVDTQADTDQAKADCEAVAKAKEEGARIRENAIISASTEAISDARETLQALDPLLDEAKSALQKVQAHVDDMEANCGSTGDVTDHLKKIRALIESLDACPGRHDFVLVKPTLPS